MSPMLSPMSSDVRVMPSFSSGVTSSSNTCSGGGRAVGSTGVMSPLSSN